MCVIENSQGKRLFAGANIVTNDGDQYYAQMAVSETPTDDFDAAGAGLRLGSAVVAPAKTNRYSGVAYNTKSNSKKAVR